LTMTPVLLDASSAILLHKADLLEAVTNAFAVYTVPSVFREITVAGRQGEAWFVHALNREKIRLYPIDDDSSGNTHLNKLGPGERDTLIAFAQGTTRFIIIDDRKGAKTCRTMAIPYINALLCPKILFWTGWIDRQTFGASFDFLMKTGWYSTWVAEYARQCTAGQIAFFCQ
jgi:predicted nucleic acid-binding protein